MPAVLLDQPTRSDKNPGTISCNVMCGLALRVGSYRYSHLHSKSIGRGCDETSPQPLATGHHLPFYSYCIDAFLKYFPISILFLLTLLLVRLLFLLYV
jgi:hypothetical protein